MAQWRIKKPKEQLPSWGLWVALGFKGMDFGYTRSVDTEKPIRMVRYELALGPVAFRFVRLTKAIGR